MKELKCEACGGRDLIKDGDYFVCQHCRVKYTTDAVKKMVIQIDGEVGVDGVAGVDNLLARAREFEAHGDSARARSYYDKVLDNDPENPIAREFFRKDEMEAKAKIEKTEERYAIGCSVVFAVAMLLFFIFILISWNS